MENFILQAHSGIRWLVVVATLVALVWLAYGLLRSRAYDKTTQRVMTVFSSLVGAQWLLGIILFVVLGGYSMDTFGYRYEHAGTMSLVLVAAHIHMMLKKREDRVRYIGGLISIVAAIILVYAGVARLPQGWLG
jgi:predicted MFS family arabinose efflux permease